MPKPARLSIRLPWLLTIALLPVVVGCASQPLPKRPSSLVRQQLATTSIPATVAVDGAGAPLVYAERLVRSLRKTGLFEQVELVGSLQQPDLLVRIEKTSYGVASVAPILTVASLGIIPTWATEGHGGVFTLERPDVEQEPVRIDFFYEGRTILGWAAVAANVGPSRTMRAPWKTDRYREALAARIVDEIDAIRAVLEK